MKSATPQAVQDHKDQLALAETGHTRVDRFLTGKRAWPKQYLAAGAGVCAVILGSAPFAGLLGYHSIGLVLLAAITTLSLFLDIGPVLFAAVLSALGWDYFFIPPIYDIREHGVEEVIILVMYFCVAGAMGTLTSRLRAQDRARRKAQETAGGLLALTRDLSRAGSIDDVVRAAVRNLEAFFGASAAVCLLQDGDCDVLHEHPGNGFALGEAEMAAALGSCGANRTVMKEVGTGGNGLTAYIPVQGPRRPLGVIALRWKSPDTLPQRDPSLAEAFVEQIAVAMERESLSDRQKKAGLVEESERLYKTLFSSLSHEVRTPLSTIIGASENLKEVLIAGNDSLRGETVREIQAAADRLNRVLGNLLDMTRLEAGLMRPNFEWCDMSDIVTNCVRTIREELAAHPVHLDLPGNGPLVRVDSVLMEQVVKNLLINAAMYTPAGTAIFLRARPMDSRYVIEVEDQGPGIPEQARKKVFEKFYRLPTARAGGTGLGLSICRGVVEAHDGIISLESGETGGARFIIAIPLTDRQLPTIEDET